MEEWLGLNLHVQYKKPFSALTEARSTQAPTAPACTALGRGTGKRCRQLPPQLAARNANKATRGDVQHGESHLENMAKL